MKDMRRVWEYHGAEHKVVFNFESGKPVTVENAQKFVTFHPRCGTSFLIVLMLLAIPIYAFLPFDSFLLIFVARIALLHLIVGVSFELFRFASKHQQGLLETLVTPGLLAAAHHHQASRLMNRPAGGNPCLGASHGSREVPGRRAGNTA